MEIGPRRAGVLADHQAREREHRVSRLVVARSDAITPLDRTDVSRAEHRAAIRAANIDRPVRRHDLRHSYAAAALAAGEPPAVGQQQFGHSAIHTTRGDDGHRERGDLRDAAVGGGGPECDHEIGDGRVGTAGAPTRNPAEAGFL